MGIWDGTPYELQSGIWRSAMNGGSSMRDVSRYDPTLNLSYVDKFAAFTRKAAANPINQVNTAQVDGSAPAVDFLKGLTTAVLSNIGAQSEPQQQQQFTPVAYTTGGGGDGGPPWVLIGLGAVAVGAVIYAAQG